MNARTPGRFKFTIREDQVLFNHTIIIDILYLDRKEKQFPLLHAVDKGTAYQAARFLSNISAKASIECPPYTTSASYSLLLL